MAEDLKELEQLRQKLNLLLDRLDKLNDPEVVQLAQQLDRLIIEEMRKNLPEDGIQEAPSSDRPAPEETTAVLWRE
ncbi:MAG: aspartyl-phosphate phosphatase Spo0E family protein [Bacillota bacterium]|nr:aspartyl-phosphate phosphatase Spo0E family protein [Bacillota bacterium]